AVQPGPLFGALWPLTPPPPGGQGRPRKKNSRRRPIKREPAMAIATGRRDSVGSYDGEAPGLHTRLAWHTWPMTPWRIRDFHDDDLDAAVRLWDDPAAGTAAPVFGVSDLITAVRAGAPTVVAAVGDDVVGVVTATISGARAMVLRISLAPGWR